MISKTSLATLRVHEVQAIHRSNNETEGRDAHGRWTAGGALALSQHAKKLGLGAKKAGTSASHEEAAAAHALAAKAHASLGNKTTTAYHLSQSVKHFQQAGHEVQQASMSARVTRAMNSQVRTGQHEQAIADRSEAVLSAAVGIARTKDNGAFDLQNDHVGVEVKTLVNGKNEKITMSKAALGRKLAEQRGEGIKGFTVVVDRRAGGMAGRASYYVREGFGSFRLGSMKSVSLGELKGILHGD